MQGKDEHISDNFMDEHVCDNVITHDDRETRASMRNESIEGRKTAVGRRTMDRTEWCAGEARLPEVSLFNRVG